MTTRCHLNGDPGDVANMIVVEGFGGLELLSGRCLETAELPVLVARPHLPGDFVQT